MRNCTVVNFSWENRSGKLGTTKWHVVPATFSKRFHSIRKIHSSFVPYSLFSSLQRQRAKLFLWPSLYPRIPGETNDAWPAWFDVARVPFPVSLISPRISACRSSIVCQAFKAISSWSLITRLGISPATWTLDNSISLYLCFWCLCDVLFLKF